MLEVFIGLVYYAVSEHTRKYIFITFTAEFLTHQLEIEKIAIPLFLTPSRSIKIHEDHGKNIFSIT